MDEVIPILASSFNRTILELKHSSQQRVAYRCTLLIEPYWNWNDNERDKHREAEELLIEPYWNWNLVDGKSEPEVRELLIEPYWNWNTIVTASSSVKKLSFNRTILELKLQHHLLWLCSAIAFNRTILELKHRYQHQELLYLNLLIEPYWNWNFITKGFFFDKRTLLIEPYWNWNICFVQYLDR